MSRISIEEVKHVAHLARLAITDEDVCQPLNLNEQRDHLRLVDAPSSKNCAQVPDSSCAGIFGGGWGARRFRDSSFGSSYIKYIFMNNEFNRSKLSYIRINRQTLI